MTTCRTQPRRVCNGNWGVGGEQDCIHDTEAVPGRTVQGGLRRLGSHQEPRRPRRGDWALDRTTVLGDRLLTQDDVRAGALFNNVVAYGGWPMDNHHPGGLR